MKNGFAPINSIPSEVFSFIPWYLGEDDVDENLTTLTHVCRGWRELLIARPSLWARLDCKNANKTRVYLERSKLSPLGVSLYKDVDTTYLEDAFLSVVPHISRLKSLSIFGRVDILKNLTPRISYPTPLLRESMVTVDYNPTPVLEETLFNGDLSSLRALSLAGVITHLPWENLSELTTFTLSRVPKYKISITQLLDFFENAHRLKDITLRHSVPTSSDAPPGRVVPLPCLKNLTIFARPECSVLLDHLPIPVGASLIMEFEFHGEASPLVDFLPTALGNFKNVSSITSASLCLNEVEKYVRLDGPSGGLCVLGHWIDLDDTSPFLLDSRIVRNPEAGDYKIQTSSNGCN